MTLSVDGEEIAKGIVESTVPFGFSTTETMDIGADLGAVVTPDYEEHAPFEFTGKIGTVLVGIE